MNIFKTPTFRRRALGGAIALAFVGVVTPVVAGTLGAPAPSGPPPASIAQQPAPQDPVAPWMRALGQVIHSAPADGSLPGGCATLGGNRVCVPTVSVDGARLSQVAILIQMLGIATRPQGSTPQLPDSAQILAALRTQSALQSAIGSVVSDQLLSDGAGPGLLATSAADARSIAEQQLQAYLSDPAAGQAAGIVPAGMSPQQYFLAPATISAYQHAAVIDGERNALAAANIDVSAWLRAQLAQHVVQVNGGVATFPLAAALH